MPLTDDEFLKDGKLVTYRKVIEGLQEQEETSEIPDYQFELDEEDE